MFNTRTIDVAVSDSAQKVLDEAGMSLSEAVNIFLGKVGEEGRLPFDLYENEIEISDEEILRKLEEAEEDFRMGRYMSLEEFDEALRRHMDELRP